MNSSARRKCFSAALGCILLAFCLNVSGQNFSPKMQAAYDACMAMRKAIGSGSLAGLKAATKSFKACHTKDFSTLRCLSPLPLSLDGHFVFDEIFADSLIAGRDVYKFAQRYAESRTVRRVSSTGFIFDKTCAVRAQASVKYSFPSKGRQELAIVTEPGGMVTLRVYDNTHDKWYNDTEDVKTGKISRSLVIELPPDERSVLEIEIFNTTDNDISFVILSN